MVLYGLITVGYSLSFAIGATKIGRIYLWNTFFATGMALVAIGFMIRIYSILTLRQYFTYSVAKVENHKTIAQGCTVSSGTQDILGSSLFSLEFQLRYPIGYPSYCAMTVAAITEASDGTEGQASGGTMPPGTIEAVADWWGVIKSTPPGAQYDDYFERQDMGQNLYFGIDSMDPTVQAQNMTLRDSGKIVHLYGSLLSNMPVYNGSQIQVDRIVVEG